MVDLSIGRCVMKARALFIFTTETGWITG